MFGETIKQDSIMEKGYEFYLKYVIEKNMTVSNSTGYL